MNRLAVGCSSVVVEGNPAPTDVAHILVDAKPASAHFREGEAIADASDEIAAGDLDALSSLRSEEGSSMT